MGVRRKLRERPACTTSIYWTLSCRQEAESTDVGTGGNVSAVCVVLIGSEGVNCNEFGESGSCSIGSAY